MHAHTRTDAPVKTFTDRELREAYNLTNAMIAELSRSDFASLNSRCQERLTSALFRQLEILAVARKRCLLLDIR